MNLRTLLVVSVLAASACSISVPPQFACPTPGKSDGCGNDQVCGPNLTCETIVPCKANIEAPCNGVCTDIVANRENCGGCGNVCGPSQQCVSGKCTDFCASGQTPCQQTTGGFICENLSNDRTNCGTCGNACGQGQVCDGSGHCGIQCLANLSLCGNACLDVQSTDTDCGTCGHACATGTHCVAGACAVICTPGQVQCTDPTSGAKTCVDPLKDRDNCGACVGQGGTKCADGQICSNGVCTLSCQTGLANCGGTCIDPQTDPNHCGVDATCGGGDPAGSPAGVCGAGRVCSAGHCVAQDCPPGETSCSIPAWNPLTNYTVGNQIVNGGNLYQCVTSGKSAASGGPSGSGSAIADDTAAWAFVAVAPATGAECVNVKTDRNNCNGCNTVTNSQSCTDGEVCIAGSCTLSCASGLTHCGSGSSAYCADISNDPANCGGCGVSCSAPGSAGPICSGGQCGVSCPVGEALCAYPQWSAGVAYFAGNQVVNGGNLYQCTSDGTSGTGPTGTGTIINDGTAVWKFVSVASPGASQCVNLLSDRNNCTACNDAANTRACGKGQSCSGGGCQLTCPAGSVACNGKCVDPTHDNSNCGADAACAGGVVCPAGTSCQPNGTGGGACVATCSGSMCGSGPSAYCADFGSDVLNCNGCGKACSPSGAAPAGYPNAVPFCSQSACGAVCNQPFADCNNDLSDGCETNLSNSAAHCGTCVNACPAADNANPTCASSACGVACQNGFGNCDNDPSNGCESDSAHDAANCGGCGTACTTGAAPYCGGTCVALASAGGVQENLTAAALAGDWGTPCFTESYSNAGTTLNSIENTFCPLGTQVMIACAAPGSNTILAAAFGPRTVVFPTSGNGGNANAVTFYTTTSAFGFAPQGAATTLSPTDIAGSSADGFSAGFGSQRLSWQLASGTLVAGGRCGDRVGSAATSNYQRLVFTK